MSDVCLSARLLGLAVGLVLWGCSVPIAANLEEGDANRVVLALGAEGVAAQKEHDPDGEGRWRVTVTRDDASGAVAVLGAESLPPPSTPGLLEAVGKGSIVPSRSSEHAKLVAGTAGELERTLRSVDGVLSARVHLAVPLGDPLGSAEQKTEPTASVLLRHRGAAPPIGPGDVQRLVAGAVPGLDPKLVSVVTTPSPPLPRALERELVRFGPLTLTRSSMFSLRIIVGGGVLLGLGMIGLLGVIWSRLKRYQQASEEERAAETAVGH